METNRNRGELDALHQFRTELAAALGDSWDWSDLNSESITVHPQTGGSTSGTPPPTQQLPRSPQSVTVGVAGADLAPWGKDTDDDSSLCMDNAERTQLWVGLPKDFVEALRKLPERMRAHAFMLAVFSSLGGINNTVKLLAAAEQLERAGNILRQLLHLGLPARLSKQARGLSRWIGQACKVQRQDCVPYRFRLAPAHADALLDLKPRERDEFVRLALSFTRARISLNRLVSEEYRIRIACDCVIWNLETVPTVVPVIEIVPLIVALEELRDGGAS